MIARNSVLLLRRNQEKVLHDIARGEAVAALKAAGMSMADIGSALNCKESVLEGLLMSAAPWHQEIEKKFAPNPELKLLPDPGEPQTLRAIRCERHRVTDRLAKEISSWLRQFEVTDGDRKIIIRFARGGLRSWRLDANGYYTFSTDRAIAEVLGIWRPAPIDPQGMDLAWHLGRWLASWIRFWIVDSKTWNQALNLSAAGLVMQKKPIAA